MKNELFNSDFVQSNRILYTPSTFAKTTLLHLQEIGELQAQRPHVSKRSNLASYLFFFVVSGSGTLDYGNQIYELKTGDCVFIDCRKSYAHRTSEDLWCLKWIHFLGAGMGNIYDKYLERGGRPCFHTDSLDSFDEIWARIFAIASSSDYIRDMKICEGLTSLVTLLMAESWHPDSLPQPGAKKQNLLQICEYLEQNHTRHISLDELAETFYINKYYLTRVFKEQFGVSINNYLLQKRITHAKQLLRFTDKTLETIGLEAGMGDPQYFSRTFKKVEGVSPSEYRKRWVQ